MQHLQFHAERTPDKPALIVEPGGHVVTYAALEAASNQAAHCYRARGLRRGDTIAICMKNCAEYLAATWGAQRSGLVFACFSSKLTAPEVEYLVRDSGATLLLLSDDITASHEELATLLPEIEILSITDPHGRIGDWRQATAAMPQTPIADQSAGVDLLYSSGTTGKPKGIRAELPADSTISGATTLDRLAVGLFGMGAESVYLSPAPLYHAAPLRWTMCAIKHGGTAVLLSHYDAELALAMIEKHRVTIAQFVPTHLIRMLKLPDETRLAYDLSSLKVAIHAAAPCPVPVKHQMIEWWGPVLFEYYASTEGVGFTMINSTEWLERPGSVGRSYFGTTRICDDAGEPVPVRTVGTVFFEGGMALDYRNDPEKSASGTNHYGWATVGDVGWVDEDGYLYLTDRKSYMIISGGVNIYPQEIEDLITTHPAVFDVAVFGAPDPDMGERVVAVVQPRDWAMAGDDLAGELQTWVRSRLSGVKTPRHIDFMQELPRHPTGKLYKRLLQDRYRGIENSRIV